MSREDSTLSCSFCFKPENAVSKLISSPGDSPKAYICDECIAVCAAILKDIRRPAAGRPVRLPTHSAKNP
jgi:ATP-dependent Clp protease ATP-binding subunit ClpX